MPANGPGVIALKLARLAVCSLLLGACVESAAFLGSDSGDAPASGDAAGDAAADTAATGDAAVGDLHDVAAPDVAVEVLADGTSEVAPGDVPAELPPIDAGPCGQDGALCDDGDACTDGDSCSGGVCAGVAKVCAADADLCTAEVCEAGACVSKAKACDDGDPCTVDACVPVTGTCAATPRSDLFIATTASTYGPPKMAVAGAGQIVAATPRASATHFGESEVLVVAHGADGAPVFSELLDVFGSIVTVAAVGLGAGDAVVVAGAYDTDQDFQFDTLFIRTVTNGVAAAGPVTRLSLAAFPATGLVLPGGDVVFAGGFYPDASSETVPWVARYTAGEAQIWQALWPALPGGSRATAVAPLPGGDEFLVAAEVYVPGAEQETRLLKVAANGAADGTYEVPIPWFIGQATGLNALLPLTGGGYLGVGYSRPLATGGATPFNSGKPWAVRLGPDGDLMWPLELTLDAFGADAAGVLLDAVQLPDGRVRAVGSLYLQTGGDPSYDEEAFVVGLDTWGTLLHQRAWPTPGTHQGLVAVAVHPQGGMALAGEVAGGILLARAEPWGAATCDPQDPCVATPSCGDSGAVCAPMGCGAAGCEVLVLPSPSPCGEDGQVCQSGTCVAP
jgi:hypothetical protein